MKKYTVKDFLKLNSPCYGCGGKINVRFGVYSHEIGEVKLNLTVGSRGYSAILSATYHDRLLILIDPKTNRFASNNQQNLINYLKDRRLFLITECDICVTTMCSEYLEFNLTERYIKPVAINSQYIILRDRKNKYTINSVFPLEKTHVSIFALGKGGTPMALTNLELPLLPHYKFRDQEHFMSKLKTYMVFS